MIISLHKYSRDLAQLAYAVCDDVDGAIDFFFRRFSGKAEADGCMRQYLVDARSREDQPDLLMGASANASIDSASIQHIQKSFVGDAGKDDCSGIGKPFRFGEYRRGIGHGIADAALELAAQPCHFCAQ